jgi:signal peptidase I
MGPDVPPGALSALGPPKGRARELAEVVAIAVILALFVRTFLVQAFVVPTGSMEPTLLAGDHVLVNKFLYASCRGWLSPSLPCRSVRRGDVIVFKFPLDPTHDYIKRAVALPGDTVEVRDQVAYVNGLAEKRTDATSSLGRDRTAPIRVSAGGYFVMGDNRANSYDSRSWGPVSAADLKGRAMWIYWSFNRDRAAASANPLRWLADLARFTRWRRTFLSVR